MRTIITIIAFIALSIGLQSCSDGVVVADYDTPTELIITHGTPYYYNGVVAYYIYNGGYYYPHVYNGRTVYVLRPHGYRYHNRPAHRWHRHHHNHGNIGNHPRHRNGRVGATPPRPRNNGTTHRPPTNTRTHGGHRR